MHVSNKTLTETSDVNATMEQNLVPAPPKQKLNLHKRNSKTMAGASDLKKNER